MTATALTEFERALLDAFGEQVPELSPVLAALVPADRDFTGLGFFTSFEKAGVSVAVPSGPIGLLKSVEVAEAPEGVLASISIAEGRVEFLEVVSLGLSWDGAVTEFRLGRA